MSISDTLEQFQKNIVKDITGLIAISITEVETGISFLSYSTSSSFDPDLASSYNLEVAKAKMKAIEMLGLDQKINNIMINLEDQIHIIDMSKNYNYFIYLAVDSKKSNLGITLATLKKYKQGLSKAIDDAK